MEKLHPPEKQTGIHSVPFVKLMEQVSITLCLEKGQGAFIRVVAFIRINTI